MQRNEEYFRGIQNQNHLRYFEVASGGELNINRNINNILNSDTFNRDNPSNQNCEEETSLPAKLISYNRVWTAIQRLKGELINAGHVVAVRALNEEALSRQVAIYQKALVEIELAPIFEQANKIAGIVSSEPKRELLPGVPMPKTQEELSDIVENNGLRAHSVIALETIITHHLEAARYLEQRAMLIHDFFVNGECHAKVQVTNGNPALRHIDIENITTDRSAKGDFLDDAKFFIEHDYLLPEDIVYQYELRKEEIEKIKEHDNQKCDAWNLLPFNDSNNSLNAFEDYGHEWRVLVIKAVWLDFEPISIMSAETEFGTIYRYKTDVNQDPSITSKLEWKETKAYLSVRHKATLIAGDILKDYGVDEIIPNNLNDRYSPTRLGVCSVIVNKYNGTGISIIDLIRNLQDTFDLLLFKTMNEIGKSAGTIIFIDESKLSSESLTAARDTIKDIKQGISFFNGAREGYPDGSPPVVKVDWNASQNVTVFLNVALQIAQFIQEVTGVNNAILGQVSGQNQAVGVTQNAVRNGSATLQPLFSKFYLFETRCFTLLANYCQKAVAEYPERYETILGTTHSQLLQALKDVPLDTFGINVSPLGINYEDLREFVGASLQQGGIMPADALNILNKGRNEPKRAIRNFVRSSKLEQQQQMQQQQQTVEAQLASQQQQSQMKVEFEKHKILVEKQTAEMQAMVELMKEKMKQSGKVNDILAKLDMKLFEILNSNNSPNPPQTSK